MIQASPGLQERFGAISDTAITHGVGFEVIRDRSNLMVYLSGSGVVARTPGTVRLTRLA